MKGLRPFPKGHSYGGDKLAGQREKLRAALVQAVKSEDIRKIATKLIAEAKRGSVPAAHELFDRIFGKSFQPITGEGGGEVVVKHTYDLSQLSTPELQQMRALWQKALSNSTPN